MSHDAYELIGGVAFGTFWLLMIFGSDLINAWREKNGLPPKEED